MPDDLTSAVAQLNEDEAFSIARRRLDSGINPLNVLDDAGRGMEIVSKRYSSGEYFLPEMVHSGDILKAITEMVNLKLTREASLKTRGKIVIGTVAGDIHDIGKDILILMLDVSGFEVFDLGVDVPPRIFVDKIQETGATMVMLSGFLTLAHEAMKETVEAIRKAGLRNNIRIIIGGGQMSAEIVQYTGADDFGNNALEAVNLARKWII